MLYFEDFSEGRRFDYKPVEMKPPEMIAFAQEFDQQPMHLDEEAGKRSILGGLAASGWHTSAIGMRMMLDAFMGNSTSQGSPGIDFMDWRKPVIAGDVLSGFSLVLEARRSKSKPDLGIVKFRNEINNQAGEPVAVSECSVLFRCRDKGKA
ncbi:MULTISPECIES: MaoC family dehydratase [Ensifer]|uniref:MaoC family dehydratase n=1 Tax=Ensifer TaxID=106591 RepID=UPI0007156C20|nr:MULTISPECIES: MaoC family dehydratase [unclassified Ensifer]KQX55241.1 enoyl-CoA hydratase [Ensifer sp. Root1298]KQX90267.1 enoyl-CoA hydratase [Ensifer sp. Root1312]KRC25472.1 enoyl-CoA hydratase [Ensifer sp. Root74]KRD67329.1 enoyl-CoA hydratase [Ensifer sp. Root954]MBD9570197.1 MaoC family dehydratase [Ensifer sp. ENS08]